MENKNLIFELGLNEESQIQGTYYIIDIMCEHPDKYSNDNIQAILNRVINEPWLYKFIDYLRKMDHYNKSEEEFWHNVYETLSHASKNPEY